MLSTLVGGKGGGRDHPLRRVREQRHRLEVLHHVVLQGLAGGVHDVGLNVAEDERVAVGSRARDLADADGAAGPAHILDDDRLAEMAAHVLAEDARQACPTARRPGYATTRVTGRDG